MVAKKATKVVKKRVKTAPKTKDTEVKLNKKSTPSLSPRFILLLAVLIIGGILYLMRSYFVAATVNGYPIPRYQVVRELERAQGMQILETLVIEELIRQEARNKNVVVTEEELTAEIASIETEIEASGQNIDDLLLAQGLTREDLQEQIRIQLLLEKLVEGSELTEEEITNYIEENDAFFPEDATDEEKRELAISQLDQQKTSMAIQNLIAELQAEADVRYWVNY